LAMACRHSAQRQQWRPCQGWCAVLWVQSETSAPTGQWPVAGKQFCKL